MKENETKREGLKMLKYRHKRLSSSVTWKEEGEYATCLGVPIGNDLNAEEWWRKKLAEVREKAKKFGIDFDLRRVLVG